MRRTCLRALWSLCLALPLLATEIPLDGAWLPAPSDGVELLLTRTPGRQGSALRMDFDFHGGAGYAVARLKAPLTLPANYEISFWMRGQGPVNNLEFKLADPGGENVWWVNRTQVTFPGEWTRVVLKKRHLTFAWGPAGGGEARNIGSIELAITAGKGGRGHLDIEGLCIQERPLPSGKVLAPVATSKVLGNGGWYQLDFQEPREFGGLVLDWDRRDFARDFDIQLSMDGVAWETPRQVRGFRGGRTHVALPEAEARFLRMRCLATSRGRGWALRAAKIQPLAFAATPNAFLEALAKDAPRGDYPRAFLGEQPYWTVVGVEGGRDSGLLGEDGALEAGRGGFSVEPMLWSRGRLTRWSDVTPVQSLEEGYLPIPTVRWLRGTLSLEVTALGSGTAQDPVVRGRYRVRNGGPGPWRGALLLALRPFQVNPPAQFLGTPGGFTPLRDLALRDREVMVNGRPALIAGRMPDAFGATGFDQGPLMDFLRRGELPAATRAVDAAGYAEGALRYDLDLPPGQTAEITLDLPLGQAPVALPAFQADLELRRAAWVESLNRVAISTPDSALNDTLRSCLAHMLISRQGPAIQPGTRSYARSWIRDGALISSVLLRMGHPDEVKDFIRWYAPYLFASGKVPCVVDGRGADPVPENDSHGEFIYLLAEYARFTGDLDTLRTCWPQVQKAVAYMESIRESRPGPFFGLMPESISHEGYSARPMHSYWDDTFALRGLKDAATLAGLLGDTASRDRYAALAARFRVDLLASLRSAMATHKISYLPGCAELGDFDATSTTAIIDPGGELVHLPRAAVDSTFERFYREVMARREGPASKDRYTPYETRAIGTLVRLGWKDRAQTLLGAYLADRRPLAWNQWPEVVQRETRAPLFLGDLPHTWVESDFLRSALTLFCFEREEDQALVLGAGLPEAWLRSPKGVSLQELRLPSGTLAFQAAARGDQVFYEISGTLQVPPGGIQVDWPLAGTFRKATVNGIDVAQGDTVRIRSLPARVVLSR